MRKLAIFTAGYCLAVAVYVYLFHDIWMLFAAAGFIGLSVLCRAISIKRVSVLTLGIAVGILWASAYETIWLEETRIVDQTNQDITVRVTQRPYETKYGAATECELNGHCAVLYGSRELLNAKPGNHIQCNAAISAEKELYRRASGAIYRLNAKGDAVILEGAPNFFESIRSWIQESVDAHYEPHSAGLVKALLAADRSGLSYETTNYMAVTGTSHAIAVSGMHVSILLYMIGLVCRRQPRIMAFLGIPVIVTFVLMTGASPSAYRAAVMQALLLCAPVVKRERDDATSLAAAALIILIQDPWTIASVSFQLSFAAVAGLFLFAEPIQSKILSVFSRPGKIMKFLAGGVSATLGATVLTTPLTMIYFDSVSIVAPLVNVLVLWAITAIFILGLLSCLIGIAAPIFAWIAEVLCNYVFSVGKCFASFPYAAAFEHNTALMAWSAFAYIMIAGAVFIRRFPVRWALCAMTAAFLFCVVLKHADFYRHPWRMDVLNVGQGQCIVLRIDDYITLIDCGGTVPDEAGEYAARFLHSAGITHIDSIVLTHFDEDHSGGLVQFLQRVSADRVYLPDLPDESGIQQILNESEVESVYVTDITQIAIENNSIKLLPPLLPPEKKNNGLSILATAEDCDILITGDLNRAAEIALVEEDLIPDVDIYVAGHHGARTSSSYELLQAARPETVVISVGKDNTYGHPHEETLLRLELTGAQVYRTDASGDLHFFS